MNKAVPELRFPGFKGSWERQKLGNFFEEFRKNSTEPDQFEVLTSARSGLVPQREYYGEGRIVDRDNVGFNIIPPNYVTYRSRSDDRRFFFNENKTGKTGIISVYYPVFRVGNGSNKFFIELLSNKQHYIGKFSVGTSQTVLSLNELKKIRLRVPSESEQQKIADFLDTVSRKITLLSDKKTALEDYKRGLMQRLFSRELRFTRDDGSAFPDWEERRLGSLGRFTGGGTPDTNTSAYWLGETAWISSSDLSEGNIRALRIERRITDQAIRDSATQITPKGAVLIVARVGIGKCAIATENLCTSQDFSNFVPKSGVAEFFAYWLCHNQHKLLSLAQGTSIKGITTHDLKALKVQLPHPDEQRKIAAALSTLDAKIDALSQKISEMEAFKNGLLQKLFV